MNQHDCVRCSILKPTVCIHNTIMILQGKADVSRETYSICTRDRITCNSDAMFEIIEINIFTAESEYRTESEE